MLELHGGPQALDDEVEGSLEADFVEAGTEDEVYIAAAAALRLSGPTSQTESAAVPEVSCVEVGLVYAIADVGLGDVDNGLADEVALDGTVDEDGLVKVVLVGAVLFDAVPVDAVLVDGDTRLAEAGLLPAGGHSEAGIVGEFGLGKPEIFDVGLAEPGLVDVDGLVKMGLGAAD